MSEKKDYNFYGKSIKWVRVYRGMMTEEQAIKYAKEHNLRWEEVSK